MQKHKLLSFLLALIVSIGLWVYAVTVVNPDDTKTISDVKVSFIGTSELSSKNLMLTGGESQRITVEVSGRRSDLKELDSTSLEVVADLSKIDAAGAFEVSWYLDPPSTVASGDISVVSASADRIQVSISEYMKRPEIKVEVEHEVTAADGYLCDPFVLSTETIAVSGPVEEVSKIDRAVVTVAQENATETVVQEIACRFVDKEGQELTLSEYVAISDPAVRVTVPVLPYKQVALKYEVIPGGGATDKDTEINLSPEYIIVTGTEEALENQPDEIILRSIDLAQFTESQSWSIVPELAPGVTNRASSPTVRLTLDFKGLAIKRFTIPCANIERLDTLDTRTFGEQNVVITVRGRTEIVNMLTAMDLHVTADMEADFDPNTMTVTLKIDLGSSSAGVVGGPYTVQVIEIEEESEP